MENKNAIIEFLQQSNYIENVSDSRALDNAVKAWEFLQKEDVLTVKNILKTHDILMEGKLAKHLRGSFRFVNVRIVNKVGLRPDKIKNAMNNWVRAANLTLQIKDKPLEVVEKEIIKDHVAFEVIHPFLDGNGRMGRILLNWQRVKIQLPILIIREENKYEYYKLFSEPLPY